MKVRTILGVLVDQYLAVEERFNFITGKILRGIDIIHRGIAHFKCYLSNTPPPPPPPPPQRTSVVIIIVDFLALMSTYI